MNINWRNIFCLSLLVSQVSVAASTSSENQTMVYECQDQRMFTIKQQGSHIWFVHQDQTIQLFDHSATAKTLMSTSGDIKLVWEGDDVVRAEIKSKVHNGCRPDRMQAVWENAKLSGVHFRAHGNEPGWHFNLINEDRVDFVTDYGLLKISFPTQQVLYSHDAKRAHFQLKSGKHTLSVMIIKKRCVDDMSGQIMQAEVQINFDGRKLQGCGNPLRDTSGDI